MKNDWSHLLAEELHKPVRRNFPKRKVISQGIDKIWAADLVEMGKFSEWNKGIKYLLMVIDVFSKFGWIEPLKNKKGETVAKQEVFRIAEVLDDDDEEAFVKWKGYPEKFNSWIPLEDVKTI